MHPQNVYSCFLLSCSPSPFLYALGVSHDPKHSHIYGTFFYNVVSFLFSLGVGGGLFVAAIQLLNIILKIINFERII